jgi:4-hydroxy-tetrahydrodipicolinate synthase
MNRRNFSKAAGLGVLGIGASAAFGTAAASAGTAPQASTPKGKTNSPAESEKKQWAREHLRGLGSLVMPTFTADFKGLDEEGIRQDVRHRIRQGFCETMVSATGANAEQSKRINEIVREEAQGKMLISVIVGGTADAAIASLDSAAKRGVSHALLSFPGNLKPETEEEVYAHYRKIIDSTSLAILLYGVEVDALRRFHPSGVPMNVFDRLADHPSVVGMKLTQSMPAGLAYEICERLSDRLLMGLVNLDFVPAMGRHYKNVQWSSQWITDSVQSPEKPYGVELMNLVRQGKMTEAMKVYWQMQPLIDLIYEIQGRLLPTHPWQHMKYYQWAMGGNGGLLPLEGRGAGPALDAKARQLIRDTCKKVGITVDRPDDEFMVGRTAYARGTRVSDLSSKPHYV